MRISLEQYSFEVPAGFEDQTIYAFEDRHEQESLTITFGTRPPEATDLPTLLELRLEDVHMVLADHVKISGETPAQVDGLPGRMVLLNYQDGEAKYTERWAVALPSPDQYLQISYRALASDAKAEERWRQILRSVVPVKRTATAGTPPGFVRRWAGRMTLDVPVTLRPPRTYSFAPPDRSERLILTSADPKDPADHLPSLSEEIASDVAPGATLGEQTRQSVGVPRAQAALTSYSVTTGAPPNRVNEADAFHQGLGNYKYANTYAVYGTGLDTDMSVSFGVIDWNDSNSKNTRGIIPNRRATGDGTVPSTSANTLFGPNETSTDCTGLSIGPDSPIRQFEVSGVEHSAMFNSELVRNNVYRMLRVMLGCICGSKQFGQNTSPSDSAFVDTVSDSTPERMPGGNQPAEGTMARNEVGSQPAPSDWSL